MSRALFGSSPALAPLAPLPFTTVTDEAAAQLREGDQPKLRVVVWQLNHITFPFQQVPLWWPAGQGSAEAALDLVKTSGLLAFSCGFEREHEREQHVVNRIMTLARVKTLEAGDTRMRVLTEGVARARCTRVLSALQGRDFFCADLVTLPDVDTGRPPAEMRVPALALSLVDMETLATRLCSQPAVRLLADPHALRRRFPSPTQLSYWAAEHVPLAPWQRDMVLEAPTTTSRLRLLLDYTSQLKSLVCDFCQQVWADASDVLNLQAEAGASYVNRHGWVFTLVPMRKLAPLSVVLNGRPTTEDCWFPGFAWTHLQCRGCHGHAGWKYTRMEGTQQQGSITALSEFYGLQVGSFSLQDEAERLEAEAAAGSDDEDEIDFA